MSAAALTTSVLRTPLDGNVQRLALLGEVRQRCTETLAIAAGVTAREQSRFGRGARMGRAYWQASKRQLRWNS